MSHVVDIKTKIFDLEALEIAAKEMGFEFIKGATHYKWYEKYVGDYPLPSGFKAYDLGHCLHKLRHPTCGYEIGIVRARTPNGEETDGYTMLFDFYGEGEKLQDLLGLRMEKMMQRYSLVKAEKEAKARGYKTTRIYSETGIISRVFSMMGITRPNPGDIKLIVQPS